MAPSKEFYEQDMDKFTNWTNALVEEGSRRYFLVNISANGTTVRARVEPDSSILGNGSVFIPVKDKEGTNKGVFGNISNMSEAWSKLGVSSLKVKGALDFSSEAGNCDTAIVCYRKAPETWRETGYPYWLSLPELGRSASGLARFICDTMPGWEITPVKAPKNK